MLSMCFNQAASSTFSSAARPISQHSDPPLPLEGTASVALGKLFKLNQMHLTLTFNIQK